MATITFYGASDDLVEVDGDATGCDEYNVGDDGATFIVIGSDGGRLRVYVRYERGGVWSAGVARLDEDLPLPEWPVRLIGGGPVPSYSTGFQLEVPEPATVVREHARD